MAVVRHVPWGCRERTGGGDVAVYLRPETLNAQALRFVGPVDAGLNRCQSQHIQAHVCAEVTARLKMQFTRARLPARRHAARIPVG